MENEISRGAMLGVVLIALAAIIGLGFGVFAIARGTANEGVTNVQENLGAVGNAAFADFDQKIVTGTQVLSALQTFEGKPFAVLIATQSMKDNTTGHGVLATTTAGIVATYGHIDSIPRVRAFTAQDMLSPMLVRRSTDTTVPTRQLTFINYNALLSGAAITNVAPAATGRMYFDNNTYRTVDGFNTQNGRMQFNGITGNLSRSGMAEFIPSGGRFQSFLVRDLSGTIMGIAFEQLGPR